MFTPYEAWTVGGGVVRPPPLIEDHVTQTAREGNDVGIRAPLLEVPSAGGVGGPDDRGQQEGDARRRQEDDEEPGDHLGEWRRWTRPTNAVAKRRRRRRRRLAWVVGDKIYIIVETRQI